MPKHFASLDEAIAYIDGELTQLSAEVLAAKVLAVTALETLSDRVSIAERARANLNHVALVGGDADLNQRLRALASHALEVTLASIAQTRSAS